MYTKFIVVVDENINTRDWERSHLAITTRMGPSARHRAGGNTPIDYLDFASPIPGWAARWADATRQAPQRNPARMGHAGMMDTSVKGGGRHVR